jgi:hypothetical protein
VAGELLAAARGLGAGGTALARALSRAVEFGVDAAVTVLEPAAPLIRREIPRLFPRLVDILVPLDSAKKGLRRASRSRSGTSAGGLPMDNAASDVLLPTGFTEGWLPLRHTQQAMKAVRDYFSAAHNNREAYRRTGLYAWELYAAMPEPFWLSPSVQQRRRRVGRRRLSHRPLLVRRDPR